MYYIRLNIYQPHAHYRIPFTYQRRHTYPIPPYSTVIGFLCNVLGICGHLNDDYENLQKIKMSIAGRFAAKTTEYIWFRNLAKRKNEARFGYPENRWVNGHIEHPGGQSPMRIDVLDEVHLVIYLAHEDLDFLKTIKDAFNYLNKRLDVLHIGRAEDWIVFESNGDFDVLPVTNLSYQRHDGNFGYFFWVPQDGDNDEQDLWVPPHIDQHKTQFDLCEGLLYRVPSFYELKDGYRNFQYITCKLNDGLFVEQKFLWDKDMRLPVFFANLKK
ncbi:MAG: CRISPR-associated protein Cas5 [Thermoflavifilum sp.]|nr:CRISPR-associated protein Cas5 [Thermoflavifilum sp.]